MEEDPVTGSNHCALVPFWAERLGKTQLRARQISAREGELRLSLAGERVLMAGQALTLWQGEWLLPSGA
ncbi:Phenazine biosynthesis-like protein [compost metagenome]